MKRLHAIVEGEVQGVGFRDFVRTHARRLEVRGWVRNRPGGAVEVMAEGEEHALARLVLVLEQGPPRSTVEHVETSFTAPTGEFSDFHVRY